MTKSSLALLISIFSISLADSAHAASKRITRGAARIIPLTATTTPTPTPTPTPVSSEAAKPAPWGFKERLRLSYALELEGSRFSNFNFTQSQGPADNSSSYAAAAHSAKLGYALTKKIAVGAQFAALNLFDPKKQSLVWKDIKLWGNWSHMIDTNEVDMQGVVKFELPTTKAAQDRTLITAITIQNNWTIKTPLRNWSFSAGTFFTTYFYNDLKLSGTGQTDLYVAFGPSISYDLSPMVSLVANGWFDSSHSNLSSSYDFGQSDPDYVDLGAQFNFGSHFGLEVAAREYTMDLNPKFSTLYLLFTAAY